MNMIPLRRFLLSLLLAFVAVRWSSAHAEEVKLREHAVHLMEVANAVSLPGGLGNYRQAVTFRVHEPDGSVREGMFTRISSGVTGRRDEVTFGDFHQDVIVSGDNLADTRTAQVLPPEIRQVRKYLPIALGVFDEEDVIRSIEPGEVVGRAARCINFDTHFGSTLQANQICVDAETGTLLRWQVGDELVENSEFFKVGKLWEPAHIRRFERGALQMEIDQQIVALEGAVDASLFAPSARGWDKTFDCSIRRRPIRIYAPMPPAGKNGTDVIDVVVHVSVLVDGTVGHVQIESSPRPDLNEEALRITTTWKFQPFLCNQRPTSSEGDEVVHFQGR